MSIVKAVGAGTKYRRDEPFIVLGERERKAHEESVTWWCERCGYNARDPHPYMFEFAIPETEDGERLTIIDIPFLERGKVRVHTPLHGECGGLLVPRGWSG